ncbi:helix-turn-helix transcriptional regulator [Chitinimonas sp. BJB300]|uniref:helix-turn-helix transcriptional regulator n=1 Tax=Chitinimonas sp. BJB300 TaxID=1559339 RepID=UPI000C1050EC|nr:AlpA family phage regulatory protein [Chitinimonas sp. BJB300]PHV11507.1 hypothetical protein CSQ89_10460 [Chitinimonas sp. BJB300]TSJ91395.1 AlpA family phage regulatory protein [Chitinimonas sp. BJB300]
MKSQFTAQPQAQATLPTIIRRKQLETRTGLSRSAIYDKLNPHSPRHDATFPTQISLGGDSVGWVESEVNAWIESRIAGSRNSSTDSRPASRKKARNTAGECGK